ncbi:uncharacterized protein [Rutidosis leptorrhynchoides]|uniref:uncharacterized protein n=1 Tax=Rutidosis leptorrhynchoides TaxID=125765 RepID=UPI003A99BFB7
MTTFWDDVWIKDKPLKDTFKRLVQLESNLNAKVADRVTWNGERSAPNWSWVREIRGRTRAELNELEGMFSTIKMKIEKEDYWSWKLSGSGTFSTHTLTKHIMSSSYPTIVSNIPTQRNVLVPKKLGVFIWRARRERLSVLFELDKRGIDLHSILCPVCDDMIETVDHALFSCKKVREIWDKVFMWWGIGTNQKSLDDMLNGFSYLQCSELGVKIWQATIWTSIYLI